MKSALPPISRGKNLSLPSRGAWIEMPLHLRGDPRKLSLPSRGAWIEIAGGPVSGRDGTGSLPSRGAWIEILQYIMAQCAKFGRSPHGERGLKFNQLSAVGLYPRSLPSRGAWIEIWWSIYSTRSREVAPLTGAWIEIPLRRSLICWAMVAPLTGSVD